ncbi:hypothetical protein N781_10320 [Pontibacillus halophilus JSM 076056 = DSM 19796]|uniref:DUF2507 domain-containing protein n=2 Tax=Pontibacillus TaxID=289201 RepID=A0A0A5GQC7_9BACI|nr:hypothetical protein N781_10320 [Pontibacillus halophilus JSM 076056 = DSM 19796]
MNEQIANLFDEFKDIPSTQMGHEVLRTKVLPDLLGKESDTVLYYIGRNLSRMYPCESIDEIGTFFAAMAWGNLQLLKEKKNEYYFELTGEFIEKRLSYKSPYSFRMEAGFLAQQIELIMGQEAECIFETEKKKSKVILHVVL